MIGGVSAELRMLPVPDFNDVLAKSLRLALRPLQLVPEPIHGEVVTRVFNHLLRDQPRTERLQELHGKRVCLRLTDLGLDLHLKVDQGVLRWDESRAWQVRIGGSLADFWALATRKEDPDTLFFHRRLKLEGDVDTGLLIKNSLDSLEFDLERHISGLIGPQLSRRLFGLIDQAVVLVGQPAAR